MKSNSISQHENFDNNPDTGLPNDIAIIKLTEAVTFGGTIQPACVPESGTTFDTSAYNCWITGWGHTKGGLFSFEGMFRSLFR